MSMMALGQFLFGLDTLAYHDAQRSSDYRHPANSRVGARPARQYVGPGEDKLTLTGCQAPEFRGDRKALDTLRDMAADGAAYALVRGNGGGGNVLGAWVIESVAETGTIFIAEGVPRRVEFTLCLARVDDARAQPDGGAASGDAPAADDDDGWQWWL
jgi:phage protein U